MKETSPYPGTYHPSYPWRSISHREDGDALTPRYTTRRTNGLIELMCWIPGARREDIHLSIRNHRFFLSACTPIAPEPADGYPPIRYQFEHSLPAETDTSWFSAELHNGLLTIRFPISRNHLDCGLTKVVIY